jgi:hypothetical protein
MEICLVSLIRKPWLFAWDMWEHRNVILHQSQIIVSSAVLSTTNTKIQGFFAKATQYILPAQDSYLLARPLQILLKRAKMFKREWIRAMRIALLTCRKHSARHWREQRMMHFNLQHWLHSGQR